MILTLEKFFPIDMKKWIAGIVIIAILFLAAVYIFIPSTLTVSNIVYCKATLPGTYRTLISNAKWKEWWINKDAASKNNFEYKGDNYSLTNTYDNGAAITIQHNNESINSDIRALELVYDSVGIVWKFSFQAGLNPFKRIIDYNKAVALKENTKDILNRFKIFIENDKNMCRIVVGQR